MMVRRGPFESTLDERPHNEPPNERPANEQPTRPESDDVVSGSTAGLGDRYLRIAELGRGGMGRVFEAQDRVLNRTVAIKEVLSTSADARARFRREITITAYLDHPAIVPIYDVGSLPDGRPFYVMRRISGTPLHNLIHEAGTLDQRLRLLPQLIAAADAIAHAHNRGVIHRDLKPGNVLVGEFGETVVIDWGLATRDARNEPPLDVAPLSITTAHTGSAAGTPGFMAPEQIRGEPLDARSDVYALGASLYQLLTGTLPLTGEATWVFERAVRGDIEPVEARAPGVPRELAAIVARAMAVDPDDRYLDAGGFGADLRRFVEGRLVAAHHYSTLHRAVRWARRHRAAVVVGSAAAAALTAVSFFAIDRVIDERNRAEAALIAERQRSDDLIVAQATSELVNDTNATITALNKLAADSPRWSTVGGLLVEARQRGIGERYPSVGGVAVSRYAADGSDRVLVTGAGSLAVYDVAAKTRTVLIKGRMNELRAVWWGSYVVALDRTGGEIIDPRTEQRWRIQSEAIVADAIPAGASLVITDRGGRLSSLRRDQLSILDPAVTSTPLAVAGWVRGTSDSGRWMIVKSGRTATIYEQRGTEWIKDNQFDAGLELPNTVTFSASEDRFAVVAGARVVERALPGGAPIRQWETDARAIQYVGDTLYGLRPTLHIDRLDDGSPTQVASRNSWTGNTDPVGSAAAGWTAILVSRRVISLSSRGLERRIQAPVELNAVHVHGDYLIGVGGLSVLVWRLAELVPERAIAQPAVLTKLGITTDDSLIIDTDQGGDDVIVKLTLQRKPFAIASRQILGVFKAYSRIAVLADGVIVHAPPVNGEGSFGEPPATGPLRFAPPVEFSNTFDFVVEVGDDIVIADRGGTLSRLTSDRRTAQPIAKLPYAIQQIEGCGPWIVAAGNSSATRVARDGSLLAIDRLAPPIAVTEDGRVYGECASANSHAVCWSDGTAVATQIELDDDVRYITRTFDGGVVVLGELSVTVIDRGGKATRIFEGEMLDARTMPNARYVVALLRSYSIVVIDLATSRSWPIVDSWTGLPPALAITQRELFIRHRDGTLWRFDLEPPADPQAWVGAR